MRTLSKWLGGLTLCLGLTLTTLMGQDAPPRVQKPKVEVVFCLDTTGSMGGLIDGAKAKIWSICNQMASGKPVPEIKVGLVAYRDRGDSYVTKVFDLTDDLDAVHKNLKTFTANGGGDHPESVNQALFDSVHKIGWSKDAKTLRIIFLVGDAPPHMNYPDDVKYPVTCQEAVKRGILINTIQCGNDSSCQKYWRDICLKAEGSYVQIAQSGGVEVVSTPYDKRLAEINTAMARSTVVYGTGDKRADGESAIRELSTLPAAPAADRAAFAGRSGRTGTHDLIDAVKSKKVKLEELKDSELPDDLKKLKTVEERKAYLSKIEKQRDELSQEAVKLDTKRQAYIREELERRSKSKKLDSFDGSVLEMIRRQAKKSGIDY